MGVHSLVAVMSALQMDVVVVFEVLSVEIKFTGRRFSLSLRRECVYTCLAVYKTYTTKVFLQMLRIDGAQSLLLPPNIHRIWSDIVQNKV